MPKVRVTRKGHARRDGYYGVGDVFTASERELQAFSDRLEVVPPATKPRKTKRHEEPVTEPESSDGDFQADSE